MGIGKGNQMANYMNFLFAILIMFVVIPVSAQTIVIQGEAGQKLGRIYGAAETRDQHFDTDTLAVSRGNAEHRSLLRFDLSQIPDGAIVRDAVLMLFQEKQYHAKANVIGIYRVEEDWSDATVTWNSRSDGTGWSTSGGTYASTQLASAEVSGDFGAGWVAFQGKELAEQINKWRSGDEQNFGLIAKSEFVHKGLSINVFSTDFNADEPLVPKLVCSLDGPIDLREHGYISRADMAREWLRGLMAQIKVPAAHAGVVSNKQLQELSRDIEALADVHDVDEVVSGFEKRIMQARFTLMNQLWPGSHFKVWQMGPWDRLDRLAMPVESDPQVNIGMLAESYAEASFALTNLGDSPRNLKIAIKGAASEMANAITLRSSYWIKARPQNNRRGTAWPIWIDDALPLIPSDGVIEFDAGQTRRIWLAIDSRQLTHGKHEASITVTDPQSGMEVAVSVRIDVASTALQHDEDLHVFTYGYLNRPSTTAHREFAINDMKEHYQNTYVLNLYPDVSVDAQGNITGTPDFTAIKQYLATIPDAKQVIFFWHWDGDGSRATFGRQVQWGSSEWRNAFTQWLNLWYAAMAEVGFGPDRVLMYPMDETYDNTIWGEVEYEALLVAAKQIKRINPKYRLYMNPVAFAPEDKAYLQPLVSVVDVWAPVQSLYHDGVTAWPRPFDQDSKNQFRQWFRDICDSGAWLWSYQCDGPMKTMDVNGYYRQYAWRAWRDGIKGLGIWSYNDVRGESSWDDFDGPTGDFAMVYERRDAPGEIASTSEPLIPSRRWHAWRAGIQEYMLLSQARRENVISEQTLNQMISAVLEQKDDSAVYEAAVKQLQNKLTQR